MPAGIGATFALGQVLAPINELVKHFSDLMLVACVSFGIQKVLISMSSYWGISLVLTIAACVWALFYLRQRHPPAFLTKSLVVLLMFRFAVPTIALGSDFLSEKFMASEYKASQKVIDAAMGEADKVTLSSPAPVQAAPWWKPNLPPSPKELLERFEKMKVAAEQATEHIVRIMGIFLLQTLVIPILLLCGLYGIANAIFRLPNLTPRRSKISGTE